jgi:hypothetical protein
MTLKPDPKAMKQVAAFRKAGRELGCDTNEQRFQEVLRTVAQHKQLPQSKKIKPNRAS